MFHSRSQLLILIGVLLTGSLTQVPTAQGKEPVPAAKTEPAAKPSAEKSTEAKPAESGRQKPVEELSREEIQTRLEQNEQELADLYQLYESLPCDPIAEKPIELQMNILEEENEALTERMTEFEKQDAFTEFQKARKSEIEELATTVADLMKSGEADRAANVQKELDKLQATIDNGTWKEEAQREWDKQFQDPVERIFGEFDELQKRHETLKAEVQEMRQELRDIKSLLQQLVDGQKEK